MIEPFISDCFVGNKKKNFLLSHVHENNLRLFIPGEILGLVGSALKDKARMKGMNCRHL